MNFTKNCLRTVSTLMCLLMACNVSFILFRPCTGLMLSSFIKYEENRAFEERFATTIDRYKEYKKMFRLNNINFSGNLISFQKVLTCCCFFRLSVGPKIEICANLF